MNEEYRYNIADPEPKGVLSFVEWVDNDGAEDKSAALCLSAVWQNDDGQKTAVLARCLDDFMTESAMRMTTLPNGDVVKKFPEDELARAAEVYPQRNRVDNGAAGSSRQPYRDAGRQFKV